MQCVFDASAQTATPTPARIERSGELFDRVAAELETLRPNLQVDGGDVRLIEIEDGSIAIVELLGACVGCPMADMTMGMGIESHLRAAVPEILAVDVHSR